MCHSRAGRIPPARDSTPAVITSIVTTGYMVTLATLATAHPGRQGATLREAAQRKREIAPLTVETAKECAGSSTGWAPDPGRRALCRGGGKRDDCGWVAACRCEEGL